MRSRPSSRETFARNSVVICECNQAIPSFRHASKVALVRLLLPLSSSFASRSGDDGGLRGILVAPDFAVGSRITVVPFPRAWE